MADFSNKKRDKVYNKTGGRCFYCGCLLHRKCDRVCKDRNGKKILTCIADGGCYHIDHVIPKSKGGSYSAINNLVPSCAKCNTQKGPLGPIDFLKKCIKKRQKREHKSKRLESIISNLKENFIYE